MFKHSISIPSGTPGRFDKVTEEYQELADARNQGDHLFQAIEAADLILATGQFALRQLGVPLFALVIFAYLRIPYKKVRRLILGPKDIRTCPDTNGQE